MLHSQTKQTPIKTTDHQDEFLLETRFGTIALKEEQKIDFPKGIVGFPEHTQFVLASVPGHEKQSAFLLLQSLSMMDLCFIVMPLEIKDVEKAGAIGTEDLLPHIDIHNLNLSNAFTFGIVAIGQGQDNSQVTINLRAPLLMDFQKKQAWQVILNNPKYEIAYTLANSAY